MNVTERVTEAGVAFRVEWNEHHLPARVVVDGRERTVSGFRRYRGSGVFIKCEDGTLKLAQTRGVDAWLPNS